MGVWDEYLGGLLCAATLGIIAWLYNEIRRARKRIEEVENNLKVIIKTDIPTERKLLLLVHSQIIRQGYQNLVYITVFVLFLYLIYFSSTFRVSHFENLATNAILFFIVIIFISGPAILMIFLLWNALFFIKRYDRSLQEALKERINFLIVSDTRPEPNE